MVLDLLMALPRKLLSSLIKRWFDRVFYDSLFLDTAFLSSSISNKIFKFSDSLFDRCKKIKRIASHFYFDYDRIVSQINLLQSERLKLNRCLQMFKLIFADGYPKGR